MQLHSHELCMRVFCRLCWLCNSEVLLLKEAGIEIPAGFNPLGRKSFTVKYPDTEAIYDSSTIGVLLLVLHITIPSRCKPFESNEKPAIYI